MTAIAVVTTVASNDAARNGYVAGATQTLTVNMPPVSGAYTTNDGAVEVIPTAQHDHGIAIWAAIERWNAANRRSSSRGGAIAAEHQRCHDSRSARRVDGLVLAQQRAFWLPRAWPNRCQVVSGRCPASSAASRSGTTCHPWAPASRVSRSCARARTPVSSLHASSRTASSHDERETRRSRCSAVLASASSPSAIHATATSHIASPTNRCNAVRARQR